MLAMYLIVCSQGVATPASVPSFVKNIRHELGHAMLCICVEIRRIR